MITMTFQRAKTKNINDPQNKRMHPLILRSNEQLDRHLENWCTNFKNHTFGFLVRHLDHGVNYLHQQSF